MMTSPTGQEWTTTALEAVKMQDFDPKVKKLVEPAKFAPKDLLSLLRNIEAEIHQVGTLELALAFMYLNLQFRF